MSRANGSQPFDAVRYSLSLIQGNWWSRLGPKTDLERAAQMLVNWGRIWRAATLGTQGHDARPATPRHCGQK